MEKKLIVIDVDGTLINDRLQLGKTTRKVLRELTQRGHPIVLASGRPWRSMAPFYHSLGLATPVITYNGIRVFNPFDPLFPERQSTFSAELVCSLAQELGKKATSFMCESASKVYLKREDSYLDKYFPYRHYAYQVGPIQDILKEAVFTLLFRSANANVPFLEKSVSSHPGVGYRHWSHSFYSEAYFPGVDKGSALLYLQKYYGISQQDTYAFGDSENDLEMLQNAGHPFAINLCKSKLLLAKFPHTEKDNNHDGVALELLKENL